MREFKIIIHKNCVLVRFELGRGYAMYKSQEGDPHAQLGI